MILVPQHLLDKNKETALKRSAGKMLTIFHKRAQGAPERLLGAVFQRLPNSYFHHDPGDIALHKLTLSLSLV